MRITIPQHHISIEVSAEWTVDDEAERPTEIFGLYLRSVEHGLYFNVRAQRAEHHPLTAGGLLRLLREQKWASPPFDEWGDTAGLLTIVGGTFEMAGDGHGEVVLEVFATNGQRAANVAGPGDRAIIAAAVPAVQRLVRTLSFA